MPITFSWLHENRVLVQKYEGAITGQELVDALNEMPRYIEQSVRPMHVFIDARGQSSQVQISLADLKLLIPKVYEGVGWSVIIQPHALQRFFTSLGMQISGAKYKFVKEEHEVMEFLMENDASLRGSVR